MLEADAELQAFASDLTMRKALGSSYHEHVTSRARAVEQAQSLYRELAKQAQTRGRVASVEVLDGNRSRRA